MNKGIKIVLGIVLSLSFTGCSTTQLPTQMQIDTADYGVYPDNYKEILTSNITASLIDPTSVIFSTWNGPAKGWYKEPYIPNSKIYYGYKVCVWVNAKNRMGGYTGATPFFAVINNHRIIFIDDASTTRRGSIGEQEAYARCSF